MFCTKCGTNVAGGNFCPNCGARVASETPKSAPNGNPYQGASQGAPNGNPYQRAGQGAPNQGNNAGANNIKDSLAGVVANLTGGDNKNIKFTLKDLFCDVFKTHEKGKGEELLVYGTSKTTPKLADAVENWTRPYLYSRVFIFLALTFFLLYICMEAFDNALVVPSMMFVGSMAIPFSVLVMLWETNIPRNINAFDIIKPFCIGGIMSMIFTLIFNEIFDSTGPTSVGGAIMVGIIEEFAKLIPVFIIIRMKNYRYIMNGLLVGAAVGAGFAVFESAGYSFVYAFTGSGFSLDTMMDVILLRAALAAGGHVVWAAMSGAAIMLAKNFTAQLDFSVFSQAAFWKLFIIPIVLHACWDLPVFEDETVQILFFILLIVIAWIFILALIKSGMSQVSKLASSKEKQ